MSWDIDIAKEFNSRNNKQEIGAQLGIVISVNPFKLSILGNKVILTEKHCYICSSLVENISRKAKVSIKTYSVDVNGTDSNGDTLSRLTVNDKNNYELEIKFEELLKAGDKVLCIPAADNQKYFILDKVV